MSANTLPNMREVAGCAVDVLSLGRNGASAIKSVSAIPAAATAISSAAMVGGLLGVPIGLSLFAGGCKEIKASIACGDKEGIVHNSLFATTVLGYAGISAVLASNGIMGLAGVAVPSLIGTVIGGIGLAMYVPLLGFGIHGLAKTMNFSHQLKKKEGEEALQWIKEQIGLDEPDPKRKTRTFRQFAFRVGAECAKEVESELPSLLKTYDEKKAQSLLGRIAKANFKQQVKYALFTFIALLGIMAFVFMLVTTGPVASALFAAGAVLWLTVDCSKLHNFIGEKCWAWTHPPKNADEKTPLLA